MKPKLISLVILVSLAGVTGVFYTNCAGGFDSKTVNGDLVTQVDSQLETVGGSADLETFKLSTTTGKNIEIGVNVHHEGSDALAKELSSRNLRTVRMDIAYDENISAFRSKVQSYLKNGVKVQVSLQVQAQWQNLCQFNSNKAEAEQRAYVQAYSVVDKIKDLITDIELLNEVGNRAELDAQVHWYDNAPESSYQNKPCFESAAAVLRGMSRAIVDIRNKSGVPIRIILGSTGRNYLGLIPFLQKRGVTFDILGYHWYPSEGEPSFVGNPYFGQGGLASQLAKFNKPIHINEFNCGEVYNSGNTNKAGNALFEACLRSVKKHIFEIYSQNIARIESIYLYEIFDEPKKAAPENRFGLMYNLNSPKTNLFLASALAGGNLSEGEKNEILSRKLLSLAEIQQLKIGQSAGNSDQNMGRGPASEGKFDLLVEKISMTPASPKDGDRIVFCATIRNRGTAPSPNNRKHGVLFSINGKPVSWSDSHYASISAGGFAITCANGSGNGPGPKPINYWIASAGVYTVTALVNDDNSLTEENRANNAFKLNFNVIEKGFAAVYPSHRSNGCQKALKVGDFKGVELSVASKKRKFDLVASQEMVQGKPVPLTIIFHGAGGNIEQARKFGAIAANSKSGGIFIYPQGIKFEQYGVGWNEFCSGYDIAFFDSLVKEATENYCVDTNKIFVTGFSWGAEMANAIGCCRGNVVKGVAAQSGTIGANIGACTKESPAYRMSFGSADEPYGKKALSKFVDEYKSRNTCASTYKLSNKSCKQYDGCKNPVIECQYEGMGHDWSPNQSEIWDFFLALS